ncbi:heavy metal-binding domain-containing protein [Dyadobacter diqingensis]|uniref:heavy metal-binding domain-containing protein n=1 Tax=Dyadobacter diqingensis TaxID=2938121 RepID=UPI0020C489C7|nr:heavy metal-binding domain-containing protein [Dyadobacter diqingensis]
MRKILFALPLTLLLACSGNQEKTKEATEVSTTTAEAKKFACPMQCEGEKTYAQAGKCPVCKMDLQEIALAETDSTGHEH